MRGLAIDRWIWAAILLFPVAAWMLIEPPVAPTEIEIERTDPRPLNDANPTSDSDSRNSTQQRPVTSTDIEDGSQAQDLVSNQLSLKIRALSSNGELMPAGTPLPIENAEGQLVSTEQSQIQVSGDEYLWLSDSGSRYPVELPAGNWLLDCTFQEATTGAPVQIPWLILARPEDAQQSGHLIIAGQTPLPPGSRLLIQMLDGEKVLDGGILTTEGPAIWWDRELVPRDWFATLLTVRFQWRSTAASPALREKVAEFWSPASRGEDWTWNGTCGVDDQVEGQRQSQEIYRWFTAALNEVETSRDLLLVAGAKARGKRSSLLRDDERVDRMLDHPLAATTDQLGRGRNFDFRRWRQLLDVDFPGRWQVWADLEAVPWPDRNPGATNNILLLFKTLDKYARLESTIVYEKLGKPRHVHDFVADFDWDPATERTQTLSKIRNFIASIRDSIEP